MESSTESLEQLRSVLASIVTRRTQLQFGLPKIIFHNNDYAGDKNHNHASIR